MLLSGPSNYRESLFLFADATTHLDSLTMHRREVSWPIYSTMTSTATTSMTTTSTSTDLDPAGQDSRDTASTATLSLLTTQIRQTDSAA